MLFIICRSIGKTICSAHFLVGVRPSCDGISVSEDSVIQKRRLDWLSCDGISVSVDSVTQKRHSGRPSCDGISVSEDSVIQKRRLDRLSCDGISVSGNSVTSGGMKQSDPMVGEINRSSPGRAAQKNMRRKNHWNRKSERKTTEKPPDLPAVLMGIRFNDQLTGS